jgi:hypothetical protein
MVRTGHGPRVASGQPSSRSPIQPVSRPVGRRRAGRRSRAARSPRGSTAKATAARLALVAARRRWSAEPRPPRLPLASRSGPRHGCRGWAARRLHSPPGRQGPSGHRRLGQRFGRHGSRSPGPILAPPRARGLRNRGLAGHRPAATPPDRSLRSVRRPQDHRPPAPANRVRFGSGRARRDPGRSPREVGSPAETAARPRPAGAPARRRLPDSRAPAGRPAARGRPAAPGGLRVAGPRAQPGRWASSGPRAQPEAPGR